MLPPESPAVKIAIYENNDGKKPSGHKVATIDSEQQTGDADLLYQSNNEDEVNSNGKVKEETAKLANSREFIEVNNIMLEVGSKDLQHTLSVQKLALLPSSTPASLKKLKSNDIPENENSLKETS